MDRTKSMLLRIALLVALSAAISLQGGARGGLWRLQTICPLAPPQFILAQQQQCPPGCTLVCGAACFCDCPPPPDDTPDDTPQEPCEDKGGNTDGDACCNAD